MSDSIFPQAFIIGANKSATSTLAAIFDKHPNIVMSDPKEPCCFSDSTMADRLHAEYRGIFGDASPGQLRVDGSTTYSRWPYRPTKWHPTLRDPWPAISEHAPGSKLIYLVRHPVDRIVSQIKHRFREGNPERLTMETILEQSPTYLDESRYRTQIEHIRRFVPEDLFFVETFERFNSDRRVVLDQILEFLDRPFTLPDSVIFLHDNMAGAEYLVSNRLRELPGGNMLRKILPKSLKTELRKQFLRGPINQAISRAISVEPMKLETRARLLDVLEPDIRMIESILGRDLPEWRR
ncbi:sulfotransferase [bacterium]|nr:sulfotransferase [bacterium]